jgi:deoxyribodipyrimidine photolyase-related protein
MLGIVFPHQLFAEIPKEWTAIQFVRHDIGYGGKDTTVRNFHIARKVFLRAAEAAWIDHIKTKYSIKVDVRKRGETWGSKEVCQIWDPVDQMLEAAIQKKCPKATLLPTPAFVLSREEATSMLGAKEKLSHAAFYGKMRTMTGILMNNGKPAGGKLRFDEENRDKIPKDAVLPAWDKELSLRQSPYIVAAYKEVAAEGTSLGDWTGDLVFPTTHQDAKKALDRFVKTRLAKFGPYEDAIVEDGDFLYHSVLSAVMNIGILTPIQVLETVVNYGIAHKIPLPSLEGFVAQVLGWREYMRAVYLRFPTPPKDRLGHRRTLGPSWYEGTTGLLPVDTAIARVKENAYLHHIERLMIVGNAMFLAEIGPTEVYRWFMEMFADSWDWVMVGNVYYMSQWTSDAITTKPYISSSAYVLRMSDYEKGEWCADWDALYWSAIHRHADLIRKNYRMAAQVSFWEKKTAAEKKAIQERAKSALHYL